MSEQQWMGLIKVVNRVKRPLSITWDGKSITVPPLGSVNVPPIAADKGLQQNRIPGTEDPYNARAFKSYLGVPDWGTDCEPIDKESTAQESLDRSLLPPDAQKVTALRSEKARPAPLPGVIDGGDAHFDGR
jgi:hypothetical protein